MDASAQTKPKTTRWRAAFSLRRLTFLLIRLGVVVLTLVAYAPLARWWTSSRGEYLTQEEARRRVHLDIPPEASDIRFYQHLHPDQVVVVDFTMPEDAFLVWAARQGWKPERIVGGITIWPRSAFGDWGTIVTVTNGYGYDTLHKRAPNTFSVTYDRETQHTYYQFSSEALGDDV